MQAHAYVKRRREGYKPHRIFGYTPQRTLPQTSVQKRDRWLLHPVNALSILPGCMCRYLHVLLREMVCPHPTPQPFLLTLSVPPQFPCTILNLSLIAILPTLQIVRIIRLPFLRKFYAARQALAPSRRRLGG
jgi:hypothetical protein